MKKITIYIFIVSAILFSDKNSIAQKFYATTYKGGNSSTGAIIEYDASTGAISNKISMNDYGLAYAWGDLVYFNYKFYGTVSSGPGANKGCLFEYDPFSNVFTVKQIFTGLNGDDPRGALSLYNNKLYGMTFVGGTNGGGTIFEWDPIANVLTKKIDLATSTGVFPWGNGLTLYNGVFYGMTYAGGANNIGVIFQWSPFTNIYNKKYDFTFTGQNGGNPYGDLKMFNNKFYGMTSQGGVGSGIIFEWDPNTNVYAKKITLNTTLGHRPYQNLTLMNNKFYGLTSKADVAHFDKGVLFEWDPVTNVYTKKHEFDGTGASPEGSLLHDGTKLVGMTTYGGGPANSGTVFEYVPSTNVLTYKGNVTPHGKEPKGAFVRLPDMPEIDIKGNNITITDGDNSPSISDYTDFGNAPTSAGMMRKFVIKNTGIAPLSITGITFSGADASNLSLFQNSASTINAGDSSSFIIKFLPASVGLKTAVVTIGTNDQDERPYDFTVQATGTTSERGLAFDGNDFVQIPPSPNWYFNSGTLEFWAKPNYASGFKYMISNGDGTFVRWVIYMNFDRQGISFWNGSSTAVWNFDFTQNNWYHFAFVQTGSSVLCYINGIYIGSNNITPSGVTNKPFVIGNIFGTGFGWQGSMDEVRFWNTQRTQSEIVSNMAADVSQQAGLFAYYRFDQGAPNGTNTGLNYAYDFSGNCTKGTLTNFTLTGATSNWTTGAATTIVPMGIPAANVLGNGITIPDGAVTPQLTDNTNLGTTSISGIIQKTFTVQNTGTGSLNVTGISFTGTGASNFSAGSLSQNPIAEGQSATVTVTFNSSTAGIKTATLNLVSNDCDRLTYDFAIQATAINPERGLSFDGLNDRVTRINNGSTFEFGSNATWEMWVKPAYNTVAHNPVLIGYRATNSARWSLQMTGNRQALLFWNGSSTATWNFSFNQNQWYHIAYVQTGSSMEVFVNGNSLGIQSISSSGATLLPFTMAFSGTDYFNGSLDDVRIWNISRTQAQIQAGMNSDLPPQAGLVVNYRFDQGIAGGNNVGTTEILDFSGNCINSPMFSFALTGGSSNIVNGAVASTNPNTISEIEIKGNGLSIPDGDNTPDVSDGTVIGSTSTNGSLTRTFKIYNTGPGSLNITGATMAGPDAGMFQMGSVTPGSPVPSNDSATFTIIFTPTSAGTKNATLIINNNDCNESSYDFAISGTAVAPERGLTFDGFDDRIMRSNNGNIFEFGANASWELWMKPTFNTASGNPTLVGYRNVNTGRWSLHIAGNRQALHFWNGSSVGTWNYSFNQNQWYHIAMVQIGASIQAFVNGVSIGTQAISSSSLTGVELMIGSNGFGEFFNGTLDDIRIWNVARTQSEIQANMNTDIAQQAGLVAYYRFDQGTPNGTNTGINEATDYSGNCLAAPMLNFALTGSTSNWTGGAISSTVAIIFAEVNVQGNSVNIVDGSTTPGLGNHTDFGSVINGGNFVRTFTIQNTGGSNINVGAITMSGSDASLFTAGPLTPAGPIPSSGSATFTVTFAPTSAGLKTATVNINNSDCDEGTYDFVIQGTGASSSFMNITLIPQGFYNISEKLNRRDTVRAYLHSNSSPFGIVDSAIAVVDSANFTGLFQFFNAPSGTYYIRLKHRNTIETWSKAGGETFTAGTTMSYDFTNSLTNAFGSNMISVDAAPLRFGIYSGDIDQNGLINLSDIIAATNDASNFVNGYVSTDVNGDNITNLNDILIAYNNSNAFVGKITPEDFKF